MTGPTERFVQSGDVRLRIVEQGEGPLVLLVHGWPELAYSWRHQMAALADAGYHVVAPDMRGYGGSDAPQAVDAYTIQKVTGDLNAIIDDVGADKATIVGHDWGAIVSWHAVLLHPERYNGIAALSVPYSGRSEQSLTDALRQAMGDNFYYILYFQQDGVAEAEFDADPRGILSRLYTSPDTPREAPEITDPKMSAGGWIPRNGAPTELPDWLTQEELDHYVETFAESGFRGGINYYRNFQHNWETTPELSGAQVEVPAVFIAGSEDMVIRGADAEKLRKVLSAHVPDLRDVILIDGKGHWIQQEAPAEVNAALISFLDSLER